MNYYDLIILQSCIRTNKLQYNKHYSQYNKLNWQLIDLKITVFTLLINLKPFAAHKIL